jgi:hypothetical protein
MIGQLDISANPRVSRSKSCRSDVGPDAYEARECFPGETSHKLLHWAELLPNSATLTSRIRFPTCASELDRGDCCPESLALRREH